MGHRKIELINFFKRKRGLASYAEIKEAGFNKALLKVGLNSGRIQKVDRALYKLSEGTSFPNPDFVAISIKAPRGVVCLISALAFYGATTEIPQFVSIAIPRGAHANKIKYPPVKFYRFASKAWKAGIEEHKVGGYKIKVYNLAKTIADCFKFRNKIGMDVARQALKVAISEKKIIPKEIMKYAKICRVDNILKPILETMIGIEYGKKKRYLFSVVEEMVMNPKFNGYRAGRIEIYDRKGESHEARFLIPEEFMEDFRKLWDFKNSDKMPYIWWDCKVTKDEVSYGKNEENKR